MGTLASELAAHAERLTPRPRIYADANVPAGLVAFMRGELEWDVLFVLEEDGLRRAPDVKHYRLAQQLRRTLVTMDRDYLDDRRFPPEESGGVLVINAPDERQLSALLARVDRSMFQAATPQRFPSRAASCRSTPTGAATTHDRPVGRRARAARSRSVTRHAGHRRAAASSISAPAALQARRLASLSRPLHRARVHRRARARRRRRRLAGRRRRDSRHGCASAALRRHRVLSDHGCLFARGATARARAGRGGPRDAASASCARAASASREQLHQYRLPGRAARRLPAQSRGRRWMAGQVGREAGRTRAGRAGAARRRRHGEELRRGGYSARDRARGSRRRHRDARARDGRRARFDRVADVARPPRLARAFGRDVRAGARRDCRRRAARDAPVQPHAAADHRAPGSRRRRPAGRRCRRGADLRWRPRAPGARSDRGRREAPVADHGHHRWHRRGRASCTAASAQARRADDHGAATARRFSPTARSPEAC